MLNQIIIGGKVVSDIELRKSNKLNIPVCDFRLMYRSPRAKDALFIDVEIWGEEAEKFASIAQRKDRVNINGELRQDNWEKDGVKRSKIKITAQKITIITPENAAAFDASETPEENKSF